jgi:hypothetical protein
MAKLRAGVVVLTALSSVGGWSAAAAADRAVVARSAAEPNRYYEDGCRCGPPNVAYVYHRDLRQTYGSHFDPRNYDQTEPHYYFGPVRRYARYYRYWENPY